MSVADIGEIPMPAQAPSYWYHDPILRERIRVLCEQGKYKAAHSSVVAAGYLCSYNTFMRRTQRLGWGRRNSEEPQALSYDIDPLPNSAHADTGISAIAKQAAELVNATLLEEVRKYRARMPVAAGVPIPTIEEPQTLYSQAQALLEQAQRLTHRTEIGVERADWKSEPAHADAPIAISLMTDTHFGSIQVNYGLLDEHLTLIEQTPNMYLAHNGDDIDNFNAMFFQSGMFENPIPPNIQTRAWIERMERLGSMGKIVAMSFGNHNEFMAASGYGWLETFARNIKAPILTAGGEISIHHGTQVYKLAMTHMYWGRSKLNPTNANKRFMDFEYPDADISFLGHVHLSECLQFEKGGKDRVAVIGGTYKQHDPYARQRGIGHRSGSPGHVVLLWPDRNAMQPFKRFDIARETLLRWCERKEAHP